MPRPAMTDHTAAFMEVTRSVLESGAQILLTVAAALFVSYLLFLVVALLTTRLTGLARDVQERSGGGPGPLRRTVRGRARA